MRGAGRLAVVAALLTAAAAALPVPPAVAESSAQALLEQSASASEQLSYTGTEYVAAWRPTGTTASLVDVRHDPGTGLSVQLSSAAAPAEGDGLVLVHGPLDSRLLRVLVSSYDLRLAGTGRCAGRDASVVEARRRDTGAVAGRFWLDTQTGLPLRREVYDDAGRRVRSSAFVDLQVGARLAAAAVTPTAAPGSGPVVSPSELDQWRREGWPVPDRLPGGFALLEARAPDHANDSAGRVLHLAYTDGLSTTSLFVQSGRLGTTPPAGFAPRSLGGRTVWARDGAPERLVWGGQGRVLTLVSDAPERRVAQAVVALPHDPMPRGLRARLDRGVRRLLSWLNPFG